MNEKDSVVFLSTDQNQALKEHPHGEGGGGDVARHRQVYCHHQGGGDGGGEEEVVFWSTKSLAKKVSFFVPYVCFHPIAANGIDVIHGCGGQQGGDVGGQQEGGGHQGGGHQGGGQQ